MKWFFKKEKPPSPAVRRVPEGPAERDVPELHSAGSVRKLAAGEALFKEGEIDGTFYYVVKGSFEIANDEKTPAP